MLLNVLYSNLGGKAHLIVLNAKKCLNTKFVNPKFCETINFYYDLRGLIKIIRPALIN